MSNLEKIVLAHRYLYYVKVKPVISDAEYDAMERLAMIGLPPESPLHQPGSDLESSYSEDVKNFASQISNGFASRNP